MAAAGDDLTAQEVADLLGMSAGELYAYVRRRQAPAPTGRVLGRPTWSRAVIDEWYPPEP